MTNPVAPSPAEPSVADPKPVSRWSPSLADFLFVSLIVWLFLAGPNGWLALLSDGDTGWHIRVGDWIREHGTVPRTDLFSFSKPGAPWFAWEWLAELLFSYLHSLAGLKGVVLFCGMLIPAYLLILFRHMLWRGSTTLLGLAMILLISGSSAIHYLARPHLFTLLFLSISLWVLDADLLRPSRRIWWLVPLTLLWANLHGGFLALVACLGAVAAGQLLSRNLPLARRYSALAAACLAVSVVNPYGIELHLHIAQYLRSDWIKNVVDEFQSPRFRSESMFYYEILLLAGAAACVGLARKGKWGDVLLILLWAHLSLGAVRHVPVFLVVAAPRVAAEFSGWWRAFVDSTARRSIARTFDELSSDLLTRFSRNSAWVLVPVLLLVVLDKPISWPRQFPESRFPIALIEQNLPSIAGKRVLASDEWGDYLLYRFPVTQRVFFDGRSDFFGPEVGKDYIALMNGDPDWTSIMDKYQFESALLPVAWPLQGHLKKDGNWRVVAADKDAVLLIRRDLIVAAVEPAKGPVTQDLRSKEFGADGLMKPGISAETTREKQR
jgi:hypothetical protein